MCRGSLKTWPLYDRYVQLPSDSETYEENESVFKVLRVFHDDRCGTGTAENAYIVKYAGVAPSSPDTQASTPDPGLPFPETPNQ
jgi:hypothetical protein